MNINRRPKIKNDKYTSINRPAKIKNNKYKFVKSSKAFNFTNFGNLYYYPGFQPNFFYFNSLLSNWEINRPNLAYLNKAHEIGHEAVSWLSNIPGLGTQQGQAEKDKTDFNTQYQTIVQILNLAIQTERDNELKFIKNKIAMLKQNFNPDFIKKYKDELIIIEEMLKTLGEGDGIDYNKFITLINIIEQGVQNTKSIFQFEAEHLQKLEKARQENASALENQIRGLAKAQQRTEEADQMVEHSLEKRNNLRVNAYLAHHNIVNLRGFKKYMKNAESVENRVADWMMQQIGKQLEKNYSTYLARIKKNGDSRSDGEIIKSYLVKALLPKTGEFLPQILRTLTDNSIDYRSLERDLIKNFDQDLQLEIVGAPENFGINMKKLELFKSRITQNNADTRSASELYNTLLEVMAELLKKNPADYSAEEQDLINNLEPFYTQNILPIENLIKKIQTLNNQIIANQSSITFSREKDKKDGKLLLTISTKDKGSIKTSTLELGKDFEQLGLEIYQSKSGKLPTSLSSVITTMKTAASRKIREEIINILLKQPTPAIQKDLEDSLKDTLQRIEVAIKGSDLEEIIQGMDHTLTKKLFTGGTFVKNDFMEIVIGMPRAENTSEIIVKALTGQLDTLSENPGDIGMFQKFSAIATDFQTKFANAIQNDMKQVRAKRKYTDYDFMAQQFFTTQEEKIKALKQVEKTYGELKKQIQQKVRNREIQQKRLDRLEKTRQYFLRAIQNTIYESSTMKTFRTYQNDIGFIGGDLGSTITSQINSFQQLFEAAGVHVPEELWTWLTSAIINCSSLSVVGEEHKDFIENYLGSLAVFSLFNEGGAELQLLKEQLKTKIKNPTNTIMHLYKMNGIYYPGSFVLKQVLKNLIPFMDVINNVNEKITNKNVMIYNPVSEKIVPNRSYSENKNDTNPWQTVSEKVSHGVKIKVLFLAGLLDIVQELNAKFASIELPS